VAVDVIILKNSAARFDGSLQELLLEILVGRLRVGDRFCRNESDGILVNFDGQTFRAVVIKKN
jgi:hypothetical protein